MKLEWIAFDADDTLWENEVAYRRGRERFLEIMDGYSLREQAEASLDRVELENLPYYGYGVMSFVLSLIETAVVISGGSFRGKDVNRLLSLGKEMLTAPPRVFDGVHDLLVDLKQDFSLMMITKGDLFHQQRKVEASGLGEHFKYVEVVSQKTVSVYRDLLDRHGIIPERFLMVGNSVRSDIRPVAALGGWALHVTEHLSWTHEEDDLLAEESKRVFEVSRVGQAGRMIRRLTDPD